MTRSPGTVTKAQRRRAARNWRVAERMLAKAVEALEAAEAAILAGELASRHRIVVHDLTDDVRNARANVGYAAGAEERAAAL
jgi:hypothetical protein